MYDMDWGIDEKPKKKRGRPRIHPEGYKHKNTYTPNGKPVGRPKTSKNSKEVQARIGASMKASGWRRKEAKRSTSADIQSSSGFAGVQDYSTFTSGHNRHQLWEERGMGSGWWGYDD